MNGRRLALTALVLAGCASVMVLRGAAGAVPPPDPTEMSGAPAAAVIAGPGRVEAATEEVEIGPELSGKLAAVLVDEGDEVAAGQVLARLEEGDHRARVVAAEARLRVAVAERERLENGARPEERREARAVAEQAEAGLEHARVDLERKRRLFAEGVIAKDDLDRAERDWRVAVARRAETAERLATIDSAARADELVRAEAQVALARATLDEMRAVLAKAIVRAPMAGVVLRRHKRTGESVSLDSLDSAIVTMADTRSLRVRVDVDERDVAAVRVGQSAWVTADAYGETRFEGRVIRVGAMLGRKNVRTDEPAEKVDTKVLETLVELAPGTRLPIGLRVDAFLVR